MQTREPTPWPYRRERAWVLLLILLAIVMPALGGLRDLANLATVVLGMLTASAYAFYRREVLGLRWAVFALGLALFFALGLALTALVARPGGGSSVSASQAPAHKPR